MLVEDAGDVRLYHALHAEQNRHAELKRYKHALDFLANMQVRTTPNMQFCSATCRP